ncbi:hypothetical protein EDF51_106165 [Curtobacterium sp. PhB25]|uniref:hypothetical protein n=1 Tax=Curtobacterium sp. PhB25 TaxID=2485205 RepID=UPI001066738F|nr:hypothetical protein [Curtobacterium sp. PhB25]TDW69181.1 hypothetical protein EDF51_106165 [Curtobacterium sp. PhB25]
MALDGVPWFIGGEAQHGGDAARMLAYLATGGRQGVASPSDLKVSALPVPGAGVRVAAGGASVLVRSLPQEAYTVRNPVTDLDQVKFAATGSAAGRSDLVICRVDNPNLDNNAPAPADPQKGPYTKFDVIPGVPAGTRSLLELDQYKGLSAIALARVDIPKSTQTITNAMITDLRSLANPRGDRQILFGTADPGNPLTSSTFTAWPTKNTYDIDIPSWATHIIARLEFMGGQTAARASGSLRLILGTSTAFGEYNYNYAAQGGQARQMVVVAGEMALPAALRGTTTSLRISGLRSGGDGNLFTVDDTYYLADVQFVERLS